MTQQKKIRLSIEDQLLWLTQNTTIKWIECKEHNGVIYGNRDEHSRFITDQGDPISFSEVLEPKWQEKFESFGDSWTDERQQYRLLYNTMRSYFVSFIGLRFNKVASLGVHDNNDEKILSGDFASSHLMQMYMSGKKALDLITKLGLSHDQYYSSLFSETRNKLFEHNFNPNILIDLVLEPSFWDVIATKSYLPIYIHTASEHEYTAYIDYYEDYYELEKIFLNVVNKFP